MPTVEHKLNFDNIVEGVKRHIKQHQVIYSLGAGVGIAGITCLIMRDVTFTESISRGNAVTAKRGIAVLGKRVVMNNVSYISSRRQGPPSWVIRCKETDQIFTSQAAAAMLMDITPSELSQHLNGRKPHALGWHFERICMAA